MSFQPKLDESSTRSIDVVAPRYRHFFPLSTDDDQPTASDRSGPAAQAIPRQQPDDFLGFASRPSDAQRRQIAILIDYENIATAGHDLRAISNLLADLSSFGRTTVRRAYADWIHFAKERRSLSKLGVELVEMPAGCGGKNSADMQLAADGMELAYIYSGIDTFVIVSGDRDFIPMASKIRLSGREIWFAVPAVNTSLRLSAHCDRIIALKQSKTSLSAASLVGKPVNSKSPTTCDAPEKRLPTTSVQLPPSDFGKAMGVTPDLLGMVAWALDLCCLTAGNEDHLTLQKTTHDTEISMNTFFTTLHKLDPDFHPSQIAGSPKKPRVQLVKLLQNEGILRTWFCDDSKKHFVGPTHETRAYRDNVAKPANFQKAQKFVLTKYANKTIAI